MTVTTNQGRTGVSVASLYLGSSATDPTAQGNGAALVAGNYYFNTASNLTKTYNGSAWQASDINTTNLAASTGSTLVGDGVMTVATRLSGMRKYYVDSVNGNDTNNGGAPDTPFKTLARLMQETLPNGCSINLVSGSRFFEKLSIPYTQVGITIKRFGNGEKPIIDGSRAIPAASWTPDGTYPNVYYADVTHDQLTSCTGVAATTCHFMCWQENLSGMDQAMTAKFDGGTIDANRSWVSSNPGSFCCNRQGSTVADPRTDTNSTLYRYYVHLTGDVDPRGGTVTIYHGEQTALVSVPSNTDMLGIKFKRTSGKDMTGVAAPGSRVGRIAHCEWQDSAVHGWVGAYAHIQDCRAVTTLSTPVTFGGGAFHGYWGASAAGTSPGLLIEDSQADGYTYGVYWHGDDTSTAVHRRVDVRRVTIRNSTYFCGADLSQNGLYVEDSQGINTQGFVSDLSSMTSRPAHYIKRCKWVSQSTGGVCFSIAGGDVNVNDFVAISRNSTAQLATNMEAYTYSSSTVRNLNLTNFSGNSLIGADSNAFQKHIKLTLTNCIMGQMVAAASATSGTAYDTIVATNSQLSIGWKTLSDIQTTHVGVDSTCISAYVPQTYTRTVGASDITYVTTGRTATGTSGSNSLTLTFADSYLMPGTAIQIVNYDGLGTNFNTVVLTWTATGSPITTVDNMPASFSGKTVNVGVFGLQVFPVSAGTCVLSNDGSQAYVSNEAFFSVGSYIYIGALNRRSSGKPGSPVIRKVTFKSGQTLTLSSPVTWMNEASTLTPSYSAFGSTSGVRRPTFSVAYGFPLEPRKTTLTVTRNQAGSSISATPESTSNTAYFTDSTSQVQTRDSTGTSNSDGGRILHELGVIDIGLRVAPTDVLTINAAAWVQEYSATFLADPASSMRLDLPPGSPLAGMGAQYVH
jgi:hypothetical protein